MAFVNILNAASWAIFAVVVCLVEKLYLTMVSESTDPRPFIALEFRRIVGALIFKGTSSPKATHGSLSLCHSIRSFIIYKMPSTSGEIVGFMFYRWCALFEFDNPC